MLFIVYPIVSITTQLNLVTFDVTVFSVTKCFDFGNQLSLTKINLNPLIFVICLNMSGNYYFPTEITFTVYVALFVWPREPVLTVVYRDLNLSL